jgi:hypothetical protein
MNDHVAADSVSWRLHPLYRRTLQAAAALLNASDPMDLSAWDRLLSDDAHLRIANRPVAVGHARCVAELANLFPRIEAMGRQFREVWPSPDGETVLMELDLVSVGAGPVIPLCIVARIIEPDPRLRDVRLYFDPRPGGLTADFASP